MFIAECASEKKLTRSIFGVVTSRIVVVSSVAAIQVVQVLRCTRAHDPWGPTSEDQIAIFFEKLISLVSHVASHSGYCREIVF